MSDPVLHRCSQLEESYWEAHHASGLTILVAPKEMATYHAALGVGYGSTHRGKMPMGVAHFLEHKMFEKPGGSYDDDFAALGAEVNAYTSYDRTVYLFSCTHRFPEALECLLTMTADLSVTRGSVAKERAIIAEEIRMNADDPWEMCYARLLQALYGHHPVREEICGTEASIRRITPRLLRETFDTYYRPANMVLAVSGPTTMEEVMAVVDRTMLPATEAGGEPPLASRPTLAVSESPHAVTPRTSLSLPVPVPLFAIGVKMPRPPVGARAMLACDLNMTVLAEMLFSHSGEFYNRLFESGLISPGMSYGSLLGEGYGYYAISGESQDPGAVMAAFRSYMKELHRAGLSPTEFDRACRVLYADYVTGFDSTEDIAASLGGYALDSLGHPEPVGLYDFLDLLTRQKGVTFERVTALFEEAFHESQYAISTAQAEGTATSKGEIL